MQDYRFFNRSAYFTALAADIDSARPGERVIVAAMTIDATEPSVHAIMAALERAAKRGIHTLLLIDAHTFLIGGRGGFGPLFFGQPLAQMRGVFGKTYEALERLKAAGGAYHIAN